MQQPISLAPEIIYFSVSSRAAGQRNVLPDAARFVNTPACGAPGPDKKQKLTPCFDEDANWLKRATNLEVWGSKMEQHTWLVRLRT